MPQMATGGKDFLTAKEAAGYIGASLNYFALPGFAKWSLMLLMLAGRIEIVALVSLILPAYWRKNK